MADMLNIATNAARTFQRALDVTSHNVANVNTEGYSRQRVEISSLALASAGGLNVGGSRVEGVERVYASYVWAQLVESTSMQARYDESLKSAKQVEGIVAANDTGIQTFIQRFFDSLQNLANEPLSVANRQQVLDEATNMQSHVQGLTAFFGENQQQVNTQLTDLVDEINSQLDTLQQVNEAVARAQANGRFPPNDLLDQRDEAVRKLSELLDVHTFEQPNGMLDVYTGGGRLPLLSDNTRTPLTVEQGPFLQENRMEIYMRIGDQKRVVSDLIQGGQLGGVLDFRRNMLDEAQRQLGLVLNGMTRAVNLQHARGWDLNGNPGGDFFQSLNITAIADQDNPTIASNDGSGITLTYAPPADTTDPNFFAEIGDYQPRDYRLEYDGAVFEVKDRVTGQPVTDSTSTPITIAPGSSAVVEGFEITIAASAYAQGDRFVLKPHQAMLDDFASVLTDPSTIATRGEDPNAPGTPAADGDNTNVANMASLYNLDLLYGSDSVRATATLTEGYSRMTANVGLYVSGMDIQLQAQIQVQAQISLQMEAISGVNLDEEAANLMRFQQAYQASAQIIQAAQNTIDTLLGILR